MPDLATERQHVGEGWQATIDKIDQQLTELIGEYQVLQIKEKFGGLRFYIEFSPEADAVITSKVWDIVHKGEEETFKICEVCGKEGDCRPSRTGWIKTLCPTHWDERDDQDKAWKEQLNRND